MSRRHKLLTLAPLLAVLLMSACATSVAKKAPTATLLPTATPVLTPPALSIKPAHPVAWTAHHLPPGLELTTYNWDGPALAQSDGDTAYLCNLANGQAQVWVTHDRAAHWTMAGSVPVTSNLTECDIVVDALQPRQALLRTFTSVCCQVVSYEGSNYLTTDGGVTWTPRDAPAEETPIFSNLASVGGVSYALAGTVPRSHDISGYQALFMSKDGMRTWRRIDTGVFVQTGGRTERFIERFWLGSSGELLAEVINNMAATTYALWRSSDQGAHWSQIGMAHSGTMYPLVVGDGQNQRFWRACAAYQTLGDYTHPPVQQISCTIDGGKTWLDTGGANSFGILIFAQAIDGALLAVTPNTYSGAPATRLLRITPGQSRWESLGALSPAGGDVRTAGADAEVLWSVMRPANYGQPLTTIYTATYP